MSRTQQITAICERYEDFTPQVPNEFQVFTRGEVGILLEEIAYLTLLLADLHARAQGAEKPWKDNP